MSSSLIIPETATASQLASAFSLGGAWASTAPASLDAVAAYSTSTNSTDETAFPLLKADWAAAGSGAPNTAWADDPFDSSYAGEVLQVTYPVGTRDGTQFTMRVFDNYTSEWNATVGTAVLTYQVRFPLLFSLHLPCPSLFPPQSVSRHSCRLPLSRLTSLVMEQLAFSDDFEYILGGKLPGLYGQSPDATTTCSGGKREDTCFSARLMWREKGAGEGASFFLCSFSAFIFRLIPVFDSLRLPSDLSWLLLSIRRLLQCRLRYLAQSRLFQVQERVRFSPFDSFISAVLKSILFV
jgi:hypothetical protein